MSEPAASNPSSDASADEPRIAAWRRPTAIVAIVLAGIVLFVGSLAVWAERQVLTTDRWTATSTDLLQNDEIRHELSVYLVDAALAKTDIVAEARDRLPAELRPLAAPLAGALRGGAINVADEILASRPVQALWEDANRIAHRALIALIDQSSSAGPFVTLDLRPIVSELRDRLGLGPAANPDAGLLVIMRSDQLETTRQAARILRALTVVLPLVALALIAAAIWLAAGWRRRAVRAIAWTAVGVGLALLLTRRLVGRRVVDALATGPDADSAASEAWSIATTLLFDIAIGTIIIGLLVAVGTWMTGEAPRATELRRRLAPVFRASPVAVWGAFVLVALLILAILPDTGRRLIGTSLILALLLGGLGYLRYVALQENPAPEAVPAPAANDGDGSAGPNT